MSMIFFQTAINNIIFNVLPELEEEQKKKQKEKYKKEVIFYDTSVCKSKKSCY